MATPEPAKAGTGGRVSLAATRSPYTTPRQIATARPDIEPVARALLGEPNRAFSRPGRPRWGRHGALAVDAADGVWFDHSEAAGGDVLSLVMHVRKCGFADAVRWLGLEPQHREAAAPLRAARAEPARQPVDLSTWHEAGPIIGTPAAGYLAQRGIAQIGGAGDALRWHAGRHAMLALATDAVTNEARGFQITPIMPDGTRGERRWAAGTRAAGAVCRLTPDDEIEAGLGLCEGVEDGLAILQREPWRGVWATFGTSGLSGFPVLGGVEVLTIFADADDAGRTAAAALARRWRAAGRLVEAFEPAAAKDFGSLA